MIFLEQPQLHQVCQILNIKVQLFQITFCFVKRQSSPKYLICQYKDPISTYLLSQNFPEVPPPPLLPSPSLPLCTLSSSSRNRRLLPDPDSDNRSLILTRVQKSLQQCQVPLDNLRATSIKSKRKAVPETWNVFQEQSLKLGGGSS